MLNNFVCFAIISKRHAFCLLCLFANILFTARFFLQDAFRCFCSITFRLCFILFVLVPAELPRDFPQVQLRLRLLLVPDQEEDGGGKRKKSLGFVHV